MTRIKSLGLAGARKALRKLFRRTPPANNEDDSQITNTNSTTSANDSDDDIASGEHSQKNDHQKLPSATNATSADASTHTDFSRQKNIQPAGSQKHQGLDDDMNANTYRSSPYGENTPPTQRPMKLDERHKENYHLKPGRLSPRKVGHDVEFDLSRSLKSLDLNKQNIELEVPVTKKAEAVSEVELSPEAAVERQKHLFFIGEALDMARLALRTNETPVGCVLVHNDMVIARGMNATNVTRNGTRHAEFMAIAALLSYPPKNGPRTTSLRPKDLPLPTRPDPFAKMEDGEASETATITTVDSRPPDEGNEDGRKGHLYPYGQKEISDERVDRAILTESTLYVTVEPCIMCASLLRQLGIKKVYFGAVNDKFGGTGGVFSIHANSLPVSDGGESKAAHPTPRPSQLPDGSGTLGCSFPPGGGDGGNVEAGYQIEGGWGRDDAVGLLRRFYVQENGRAPVPRKKEGRAARLAAMMEQDGDGLGSPSMIPVGLTDVNEDVADFSKEENFILK